ncbi:hypothetical protein BHM03_00061563 [Ensete ventricosum]|nr:hypothetical protein BHM03_00061563 [Ensete ventricosum]
MGRVTYEYGYRVAWARFRTRHPDADVEEDPFTIYPEDDSVPMERRQDFDDSWQLENFLRGAGTPGIFHWVRSRGVDRSGSWLLAQRCRRQIALSGLLRVAPDLADPGSGWKLQDPVRWLFADVSPQMTALNEILNLVLEVATFFGVVTILPMESASVLGCEIGFGIGLVSMSAKLGLEVVGPRSPGVAAPRQLAGFPDLGPLATPLAEALIDAPPNASAVAGKGL